MKRIYSFIILVLLLSPLSAQSTGPNLDFAFDQWKSNGPEPFAKALYGSNVDRAKQLASELAPLVKYRGEYLGYEIIVRTKIGQRMERLIIAIYFENAPLFMRIDLYESANAKIFLPAVVSKDASDILPFDIVSTAGK